MATKKGFYLIDFLLKEYDFAFPDRETALKRISKYVTVNGKSVSPDYQVELDDFIMIASNNEEYEWPLEPRSLGHFLKIADPSTIHCME